MHSRDLTTELTSVARRAAMISRATVMAAHVWCSGLFGLLLGDLLDHPPEEVRVWLFDPEPFELRGDLTAVVGAVINNVAQ